MFYICLLFEEILSGLFRQWMLIYSLWMVLLPHMKHHCHHSNMSVFHFAGNEPSPLGSVESYNPVKRRWEYVAPMPTARCSSALLQATNMLFVIGGVSQGPSNAVEALCMQEAVWHKDTHEHTSKNMCKLALIFFFMCVNRDTNTWNGSTDPACTLLPLCPADGFV